MILHSYRKGNDCIRKLRCHCIQILHSDIYSVHCGKMEGENAGGTNQAMPLPWWMEALKIRGGFWQSMLHSRLLLRLCSLDWELRVSAELRVHTIYFYKKRYIQSLSVLSQHYIIEEEVMSAACSAKIHHKISVPPSNKGVEALKIRGGFWQSMLHSRLLLQLL